MDMKNILPFSLLLFLPLSLACSVPSSAANYTAVGDGYCDPHLNTADLCYDGGDCCTHTCTNNLYGCGAGGYSCQLAKRECSQSRLLDFLAAAQVSPRASYCFRASCPSIA
jgi:hypothetical protein